MKALVVIGTRPEAIKLAPVVWELRKRGHEVVVCATGQHRELLDGALTTFGLTAAYDLNVMRPDQSPDDVMARVIEGMGAVLKRIIPDWVIVEGDTTSVVAASMAAFHARYRVAHVEAGLRSWDKRAPFPEEINRRLASVLADLHCAPTTRARDNLLREGISGNAIRVTGNPAVDAIRWAIAQPAKLSLPAGKVVVVTVHRRENHGTKLDGICTALRTLAREHRDVLWICPVHPNPHVGDMLRRTLDKTVNVRLVEPLDYVPMAHLIARSEFVLTDSGGLQEEAPSLGVPALVLRDVTERPEGIEAGAARLVGTAPDGIVAGASRALAEPIPVTDRNLYGDGRAGEKIVEELERAEK